MASDGRAGSIPAARTKGYLMDKWRVTFIKKVEFDLDANSEAEAITEAMRLDLDSLPLEWEMDGPYSLTQVRANSTEPIVEDVIELDSYGRPVIDLDGEEDEQDYV